MKKMSGWQEFVALPLVMEPQGNKRMVKNSCRIGWLWSSVRWGRPVRTEWKNGQRIVFVIALYFLGGIFRFWILFFIFTPDMIGVK